MNIFGLLATPLGFIMRLIHMVIGNYGWVIVIFTFLVRILMFPLTLKQQKSTARTSAYQPMIQEIQKKWANDKQRQQQEMQKFYEENNIKMTAGCAPMLVNMLVLFGIIAVIQAPLTYILQVPQEQVNNGVAIVEQMDPSMEIAKDTYTLQSRLIGEIKENPDLFIEGVDVTSEEGETVHTIMEAEEIEKIVNFDFQFLGLDLSQAPTLNLNRNLIMPILSVLTMFASQFIIMKFSGSAQQGQGKSMWIMTIVMGVMFGFFAFRVPLGFSLYYTVSNLVMTIQQIIVKQIHDPAKVREEIEREMEEKRLAKKSKKKITVKEADGSEVSLDLSDADIARMRLQRARELDAKLYGLNEAQSDEEKQAQEKARALDDERYGKQGEKADAKMIEAPKDDPPADGQESDKTPTAEADEKSEAKQPAKPGRRKRARQNKESKESEKEESFAQQEKRAEEDAGEPTDEKEDNHA